MDTKNIIIVVLIVAIVAFCALFAGLYLADNVSTDDVDDLDNTTNSTQTNDTNDTDTVDENKTAEAVQQTDLDLFNSSGKAISKEKVWDGQDGKYMYEVHYSDGELRQYNLDGSLMGSTYEEDQAKLREMYGSIE